MRGLNSQLGRFITLGYSKSKGDTTIRYGVTSSQLKQMRVALLLLDKDLIGVFKQRW